MHFIIFFSAFILLTNRLYLSTLRITLTQQSTDVSHLILVLVFFIYQDVSIVVVQCTHLVLVAHVHEHLDVNLLEYWRIVIRNEVKNASLHVHRIYSFLIADVAALQMIRITDIDDFLSFLTLVYMTGNHSSSELLCINCTDNRHAIIELHLRDVCVHQGDARFS